jgi:hypothetical protein
MPIDPAIDPAARRVSARAHGVLRDVELFEYQRLVWSRDDVAGFDEFVDLSDVTELEVLSTSRPRELAWTAALMDVPGQSTRLAIVAPTDYLFGLARMYAAYRGLQNRGAKLVQVFRTRDEARAWLEEAPERALPRRP